MTASELTALAALRLDATRQEEDVWANSPYHVDGLHPDVAELVLLGIDDARTSAGPNPRGVAIQGERGVGKTHLLGWVREQVQHANGYFFLVTTSSGTAFWETVREAVRGGLHRPTGGHRDQLDRLLTDLSHRAGLADWQRDAVTGRAPLSRKDLDAFVEALRLLDRVVGMDCQDTARALVLLASTRQADQDVGFYYLDGEELQADERRAWGIRSHQKGPEAVVTELSRLLALSGPTVLAVDQIDALIHEIGKMEASVPALELPAVRVATGLMELRDKTRRTLTIVACLPQNWAFLATHAVDTVTDRFRPASQLQNIPSAEIGRALVEKRFARELGRVGFVPPYPTWPVRPGAFTDAPAYTVRRLLQRIEDHVRACLRDGAVRELDRLDEWAGGVADTDLLAPQASPDDLAALDARFQELREAAEVTAAFDPRTEDAVMPALLAAGLASWLTERAGDGQDLVQEPPPPQRTPTLHARLRQVLDERTDDERQWSFRAIATDNARAAKNRLASAVDAAGLANGTDKRRLFVLRNNPWPRGAAIGAAAEAFAAAGGQAVGVTADDLRTYAALGAMRDERHPGLDGWLAARRPAGATELFRRALADATSAGSEVTDPRVPRQRRSPEPDNEGIPVGVTVGSDVPVSLDLEMLRKHVAIFAGSGSGKTVLIRRMVEESALRGVSTIVIDQQNDLARLGEAVPEPPEGWAAGDAARAREYLDHIDVVVWTPGRQAGRPLSLPPLPAFAELIGDPDELAAAVKAAVEALAPRVNANRDNAKANRERAVLTEALYHFARAGGGGLPPLRALLEALPDGVSRIRGSAVIAAELADRLTVAMVNDPLFGGSGEPADPGMLLAPPPGKRARISVVSLIGLPSADEQQGFINRLQVALFSWVKKHPAGDGPPGGLLVMDEAHTLAPAVGRTACTQSTLMLAAQARKYGLGLVFATQSPRGLHNQIAGNAATQFVGSLQSATQIAVVQELARGRGGDVSEISRLQRGQFYLATEGRGFRKIRSPMCLSHHPASPLTEEEVLARAGSAST